MSTTLSTAEARHTLTAALAAASIEAPHQTAALAQSLTPLALQIIAGLISQAYNNGWRDGEQAATLDATYSHHHTANAAPAPLNAETYEQRNTDRLNHL